MATVAGDGPFSTFAGVDRTLCILDGAGIRLRIDDAPARQIDVASEPLSFSGDAAAHSTLIDGAVTDFNVMTRRGRLRHAVTRVRLRAAERHDLDPDVLAVFCQQGTVSIDAGDTLAPHDTWLRRRPDAGTCRLSAVAAATVYLVTISALS